MSALVQSAGARGEVPANERARTSRAPVQAKPRITARSRTVFLRELAATCNITAAAAKAGHHRGSFYRLRNQDAGFAEQWAEALAEAVDRLEAEAFRLAAEGVTERTYNADGDLVSSRTREDPRLIQFLLSAHRPDVYRERVEVEGGAPVTFQLVSLLEQARAATGDEIEGELVEDEPAALEAGRSGS